MGVRRVGKCPFPPWKLGLRTKYFPKNLKSASSIPINWFDSCNDSFFADMKLTLHKGQVHSYSVMQWWDGSSFMSLRLPAEAGCESRVRIVLLLVFIA